MISGLVWKLATTLALLCSLAAIVWNGNDIEQVCATVQRQLDRNAATLERSLAGLALIQYDPQKAVAQNIPGADYYASQPDELARAIERAKAELAIYHVNAC